MAAKTTKSPFTSGGNKENNNNAGWSGTDAAEWDNLTQSSVKLLTSMVITFKDLFEYQGFDPRALFEHLRERMKQKKVKVADFFEYVTAALVFFVSRGSKYGKAKVKGKTKVEGREAMDMVYAILEITDEVPTSSTTVTLARLSSVFPVICADLCNGKMNRQVSRFTGFKALQFPAAASLIPKGDEWDPFFKQWLDWAYDYDAVVNPTSSDKARVLKYANFARGSNYINDGARVNILLKFGYDPTTTMDRKVVDV